MTEGQRMLKAAARAYMEAVDLRDPVAFQRSTGELQVARIQLAREAKAAA